MELIKKTINLGALRSYKTPLVYELITKELRQKGCCVGLNNKQIILQNAEEFDRNWGALDFEYIHLNVFLTQNIDDMGLFTDVAYVDEPVNYNLLIDKFPNFTTPPSASLIFTASTNDPYIRYFARLSGQSASDFYASNGVISGLTDDKLYTVTTYFSGTPLLINFNLSDDPNYFTGVNDINPTYTEYTINALNSNILGTGLHYYTYTFNRLVYNAYVNNYFSIPYTEVRYQSEGWNGSNTSLSALTKEEVYFGIVFPPKVENNVFIDRGTVTVFEKHSRMSSILTMEQLEEYGNGYFNLIG
jgi:hypothetical protein